MDAIVYREANREVFGRGVCAAHLQRGCLRQGPRRVCKGSILRDVLRLLLCHKGDARRQGRERQEHFRIEEGKSCGVHQQPGHSAGAEGRPLRCGRVHSEEREESEVERRIGRLRRPGAGEERGRRSKAPTPKAPEIIIPKSGTASSAKAGGTSKTPKVSGNVIADFTKTASGTDIQKAVTQAKRKALKAGNRTVYVEEGSPIDYFLKYGKLPSLK